MVPDPSSTRPRHVPGRPGRPLRLAIAALAAAALLASCSGSSAGPTSAAPSSTTTTAAPRSWSATASAGTEVDGRYRQGLARLGDGWVFTNNKAIYRTDDAFVRTGTHEDAIPPELAAQGYDHLGDPDVADGMIWIPVERDDKTSGVQVTARYDAQTLEYVDSFAVRQHHNAFVAVAGDGTVYSADQFDDDAIVRYRVTDGTVRPLSPLRLSQTVERIQGADLAGGALWLSTDDDHNGVYRVDLRDGAVSDLGSMGRVEGEGEGIDATDLPTGLLHTVVADQAIVPMWVVDLRVSSRPAS